MYWELELFLDLLSFSIRRCSEYFRSCLHLVGYVHYFGSLRRFLGVSLRVLLNQTYVMGRSCRPNKRNIIVGFSCAGFFCCLLLYHFLLCVLLLLKNEQKNLRLSPPILQGEILSGEDLLLGANPQNSLWNLRYPRPHRCPPRHRYRRHRSLPRWNLMIHLLPLIKSLSGVNPLYIKFISWIFRPSFPLNISKFHSFP